MTAVTVRAKAAQLVRDHAARLGMDQMAAGILVRAIEAIEVEDHTDVIARRMGAEFVPTMRLTEAEIEAGRTPAGGWRLAQGAAARMGRALAAAEGLAEGANRRTDVMMNDRIAIELADLWENESIDAKPAGRAEALRECADALRMMASATLPGQRVIDTTLQPERAPTHRCKICGAFWMRWSESWSLCSKSCGECCDNAAMGDQIVPLIVSDIFTPSAVLAHIEQLRADYASVHILCDNDDATYRSEAMAIEVSAEWTGWDPKRFYGEDVADCLAKAVQAKAEWKP